MCRTDDSFFYKDNPSHKIYLFIICCFTSAQEFFTYKLLKKVAIYGDVTIASERLQIKAYACRSGPLSRDLYSATPAVTQGLGLSGLIRRTAPFNRLILYTWGYGGSTCIPTQILRVPFYKRSEVKVRR
jgi:hypothetical protein